MALPSHTAAPQPVRVTRVITRLNIGGPSIQATRLTSALDAHGFDTRLLHGRLGEGEGDMSYLIAPGADARFVPTLCRPLSPIDDLRTLWRLYRELRAWKPAVVHTHMAKAGLLGRLAAAAYNLTRGSARQVVRRRREAAEQARLGHVRVDHRRLPCAQFAVEAPERAQIVDRREGSAERRHESGVGAGRDEVRHVAFALAQAAVQQARVESMRVERRGEARRLDRRSADVEARDHAGHPNGLWSGGVGWKCHQDGDRPLSFLNRAPRGNRIQARA